MISSIGVTDDNAEQPPTTRPRVSAASGTGRVGPAWIADVDDAPVDTALVLLRGGDGVLRLQPADITVPDHTHPGLDEWGDRIRFRAGAPTPDPAAPPGAVHIDTTTGRGYRLTEQE